MASRRSYAGRIKVLFAGRAASRRKAACAVVVRISRPMVQIGSRSGSRHISGRRCTRIRIRTGPPPAPTLFNASAAATPAHRPRRRPWLFVVIFSLAGSERSGVRGRGKWPPSPVQIHRCVANLFACHFGWTSVLVAFRPLHAPGSPPEISATRAECGGRAGPANHLR
jgi:hypothetical protein